MNSPAFYSNLSKSLLSTISRVNPRGIIRTKLSNISLVNFQQQAVQLTRSISSSPSAMTTVSKFTVSIR